MTVKPESELYLVGKSETELVGVEQAAQIEATAYSIAKEWFAEDEIAPSLGSRFFVDMQEARFPDDSTLLRWFTPWSMFRSRA